MRRRGAKERAGWKGRYALLLVGFGAQRLAELWLSSRHERALVSRGLARVRERGFPLMVAAHLAPFLVGPLEVARRRHPPPRALLALSLGALAAAALLRGAALRALGPSWSVRIHAGPAMRVCTSGPYCFIRHPNYLAVILELAALPLAGGAVGTALVASLLDAAALALRIGDEERALARSPAWRRQMADKPRFLPLPLPLPRLLAPARC